MSTFAVSVVEIESVSNHPNADRLDLLKFKGMDWQVVTAKGNFKPNDLAIYFPIDSLLPQELEAKIFGADSKVKLNNSRIRTIKLRGALSQGMCIKPDVLGLALYNFELGNDFTKKLGVTKYEPVVKTPNFCSGTTTKNQTNPHFRKYTGIENAKNYNNIFTEGEEVVVTEKIHGTNFRAGVVTTETNTLWKKIKKLFGVLKSYEFVYGSHQRQLQDKMLYKGFYETNVYAEATVKYNLKDILKPNEQLFGEIYGDGIQKGYNYGCKRGERKVVFFEVKVNDQWLDPIAAKKWFDERQLPFVPTLYKGPFEKEKILVLREGPSVLDPNQLIREGVVVRAMKEETCYIGRKMLKFISDNYLLKNQDNEEIAH